MWFPLLSTCNLRQFDTSVFASPICTAKYALSFLNISSVGTNFETFREQVGYLHFALLRRARKFD